MFPEVIIMSINAQLHVTIQVQTDKKNQTSQNSMQISVCFEILKVS